MRTHKLPTTTATVYMTEDGVPVRQALDRPAWCTDVVCVVSVDEQRVWWIKESKLFNKEEWINGKKEKS